MEVWSGFVGFGIGFGGGSLEMSKQKIMGFVGLVVPSMAGNVHISARIHIPRCVVMQGFYASRILTFMQGRNPVVFFFFSSQLIIIIIKNRNPLNREKLVFDIFIPKNCCTKLWMRGLDIMESLVTQTYLRTLNSNLCSL